MPGCGWRTRNPAQFVAVDAVIVEHMLSAHTHREVAEALLSAWQYQPNGHRRDGDDPLTFVPELHEEEQEDDRPELRIVEPRAPRRSTGRKSRFDKTYAQMAADAFAEKPGEILTTSQIRDYMSRVTGADILTTSICATLHKMEEDGLLEHVAMGQWQHVQPH